jgi:hypothetical protein
MQMNATTTDGTTRNQPRRIVRILRAVIFGAAVVATVVAFFYAEENWRGERAWEAHVKAMAALGERLDWESFLPAPVPDDQNFAKTPMLEALAYQPNSSAVQLMTRLRALVRGQSPEFSWVWGRPIDWQECLAGLPAAVRRESSDAGASPTAQILAILKPLEPVLVELRAAARTRPSGQFRPGLRLTSDNRFDIPNMLSLLELSQLLGFYVTAELTEGRTNQAFEDALVLHRLATVIGADGDTLLEVMVCQAICNGPEMQVFWDGWRNSRWTPVQYEAMQTQFGAWNAPAAYNRALRRERAFSDQLFSGNKFDISLMDLKSYPNWQFALMPRGWWRQNLITYDLAMQQALANGFDEMPPRYRPAAIARLEAELKDLKQSRSPFLWLAAIGMANFDKIGSYFAGQANRMPMADVVCALERYRAEHGEYPEALEALVPKFAAALPTDLYTGQPFRYQRTPDAQFLLYSIGPDGKDDDGVKGDDWAWPARSVPQVNSAHDDESPQNGLNSRERYQSEINRRRSLRAGAVQGQAQ